MKIDKWVKFPARCGMLSGQISVHSGEGFLSCVTDLQRLGVRHLLEFRRTEITDLQRVEMASTPGRGFTFTIRIPRESCRRL